MCEVFIHGGLLLLRNGLRRGRGVKALLGGRLVDIGHRSGQILVPPELHGGGLVQDAQKVLPRGLFRGSGLQRGQVAALDVQLHPVLAGVVGGHLERLLQLLAGAVEGDEHIAQGAHDGGLVGAGALQGREREAAEILIELRILALDGANLPGALEHHAGAGVEQGAVIAVIRGQGVDAGGEVALFHPLLDLLAGVDGGVVHQGAGAVIGLGHDVRTAVAGHQVHIVHGTGPLGLVSQGEGGNAVGHHLVAQGLQLGDGGGDLIALLRPHGLVIEEGGNGVVLGGQGVDLAVHGALGQGGLGVEVPQAVFVNQRGQVLGIAGVHILHQVAAGPVDVDVRALAGAHGHRQLALVLVVHSGDLLDRVAAFGGVFAVVLVNGVGKDRRIGFIGRDVPVSNGVAAGGAGIAGSGIAGSGVAGVVAGSGIAVGAGLVRGLAVAASGKCQAQQHYSRQKQCKFLLHTDSPLLILMFIVKAPEDRYPISRQEGPASP